jgi:hypothetical protein
MPHSLLRPDRVEIVLFKSNTASRCSRANDPFRRILPVPGGPSEGLSTQSTAAVRARPPLLQLRAWLVYAIRRTYPRHLRTRSGQQAHRARDGKARPPDRMGATRSSGSCPATPRALARQPAYDLEGKDANPIMKIAGIPHTDRLAPAMTEGGSARLSLRSSIARSRSFLDVSSNGHSVRRSSPLPACRHRGSH